MLGVIIVGTSPCHAHRSSVDGGSGVVITIGLCLPDFLSYDTETRGVRLDAFAYAAETIGFLVVAAWNAVRAVTAVDFERCQAAFGIAEEDGEDAE